MWSSTRGQVVRRMLHDEWRTLIVSVTKPQVWGHQRQGGSSRKNDLQVERQETSCSQSNHLRCGDSTSARSQPKQRENEERSQNWCSRILRFNFVVGTRWNEVFKYKSFKEVERSALVFYRHRDRISWKPCYPDAKTSEFTQTIQEWIRDKKVGRWTNFFASKLHSPFHSDGNDARISFSLTRTRTRWRSILARSRNECRLHPQFLNCLFDVRGSRFRGEAEFWQVPWQPASKKELAGTEGRRLKPKTRCSSHQWMLPFPKVTKTSCNRLSRLVLFTLPLRQRLREQPSNCVVMDSLLPHDDELTGGEPLSRQFKSWSWLIDRGREPWVSSGTKKTAKADALVKQHKPKWRKNSFVWVTLKITQHQQKFAEKLLQTRSARKSWNQLRLLCGKVHRPTAIAGATLLRRIRPKASVAEKPGCFFQIDGNTGIT